MQRRSFFAVILALVGGCLKKSDIVGKPPGISGDDPIPTTTMHNVNFKIEHEWVFVDTATIKAMKNRM
jgi:hypothetical protein